MATFKFEYPLEIIVGYKTFDEIILTVEAEYHPGEAGERDSHGCAIEPDFAPYFEVLFIEGPDGRQYTRQDLPKEWNRILDAASDAYDNIEQGDAFFDLEPSPAKFCQ